MTDLVHRELELAASPEEVWEALTDPAWLRTWLADEASLQLWPGGDAEFRIGNRILSGWVEEVRPPAQDGDDCGAGRLAFWWGADGEPSSRVELTLSAGENGTLLRIVETRPLQVLDLVGIPLPGPGGPTFGPALVAGAR